MRFAPALRLSPACRFGLTLIALIASGCGGDAPPPPPAPQVTVATVIGREINEWDEFTGRLQAVDAVEIRPQVSGKIQRVGFTEGTEVRKGDLLFVIDPRPYQAELDRAQAELERTRTQAELAKRDLERAQTLVAKEAISREEFDIRAAALEESGASIRAAEANVAQARLDVEWTRVRSPIDGRVSRAEVTAGNLVDAGPPSATLLTTVMSIDPIYVYFEGDEQTYLKYGRLSRSGERASSRDSRNPIFLGLSNEEGFPHEGYVDFVDNQLDPSTGTIRARAVFSNARGMFTPGLFARLKLIGSGRYRAVLVRDSAIGTDQDKKFVLVLKADNTVEYRRIELGRLVEGLRIVSSGLEAGERIVVNGLQRVRPGITVNPQEEPMVSDSAAAAPE
ncbi:MAG: efflux RND transporter periplasmic adaptor subunit [Gemmatimonadetes bacterium]|nr:efflux RND transporter periplasmic adaptor subunit [Gemmatimonadota bacterium]